MASVIAALLTWGAVHYLTGFVRLAMLTQRPTMDQPLFLVRGAVDWRTPLWVHLALRPNRALLFLKAAVVFAAAWALWAKLLA